MKFKIGDKVMLKAVPYENFLLDYQTEIFYTQNKNKIFVIRHISENKKTVVTTTDNVFFTKYLKHAVKPKVVKYTIDCRGMACGRDCSPNINGDIKICEFIGTKSQVEAHIKRYWKQPKIKAVVK
jgi:hypothetical protein